MSLRTLSIASTGGLALQNKIDTIANNIANVNTVGYKKTRGNFADLFYQEIQRAGFGTPGVNQPPTGLFYGTGVKLVSTQKLFSQGAMQQTDNGLDVAIQGDGFFRVTMPDGQIGYTRAGNFNRNGEGTLVTAQGYVLDPQVTIPANVTDVMIDESGRVLGLDPTNPAAPVDLGLIQLTRFVNASGLDPVGDNLFRQTAASGDAVEGQANQNGFGALRSGFLEESNVDVISQLVDLISTQRAFEINARTIETADQILQTINNLKR